MFGALYNLTAGEEREEYLAFVTQWLRPASSDLNGARLEGYWERRLMAVRTLEDMPEASSAVPLLESMLLEDDAKSWVAVHVPRVLSVLKRSGG